MLVLGRNGGHLSAHNFMGFVKDTATWGIFDAIKSVRIEEHVVNAITSLVKNAGLESEVDLVEGVRTNLFFTAEEKAKAQGEYEAAKAAGVDVSAVEWLSERKVEAVRQTTAIMSSWFYIPLTDIRSALSSCPPPRKHDMASQTRNPPVPARAKRLGGIHSQTAHTHARNGSQTLP